MATLGWIGTTNGRAPGGFHTEQEQLKKSSTCSYLPILGRFGGQECPREMDGLRIGGRRTGPEGTPTPTEPPRRCGSRVGGECSPQVHAFLSIAPTPYALIVYTYYTVT